MKKLFKVFQNYMHAQVRKAEQSYPIITPNEKECRHRFKTIYRDRKVVCIYCPKEESY